MNKKKMMMMMIARPKLRLFCVAATLVVLLATGCNRIDSDAKKAAGLTNKSIEQTRELKLKEAERSYLKAQKIIVKYREHKKAAEFDKRFRKYRDKGRLANDRK